MGKGIHFNVENHIREALLKIAVDITNEKIASVEADVIQLTPVGKSKKNYTGGRLRIGWGVIPASISGRVVRGYLYNSVSYAGHVNYGHRTRLGMGARHTNLYYPNGTPKKRVVKGRWFLQKALRMNGFNVIRRGGY